MRRVDSGTPGLDEVLHGGFISGQTAIVNGGPGTGKTVLALQFLSAAEGDALYIGFEEREGELRRNARSLGIDLSEVSVLDLSADGDRFFDGGTYSVLPHEEIEGENLIERIATAIDEYEPERLAVDPLTQLRSLLPDDYQFRRNISSFINELKERDISGICTTQYFDKPVEADLQFLGNTVLDLERTTRHRSIEVTKFRGSSAATGQHTLRIENDTGARVYPKLVPGDHYRETSSERLPSDVEGFDDLLGGGIERGTVTLLTGPSGVGKTTTGTQFLVASAERGERTLALLFEELRPDFVRRSSQLGIEVERLEDEGVLEIAEVEPITRSTDEFAHQLREAVEERDVETVMIDGIAGYRLGLRGDDSQQELARELHSLCRYLERMGTTVVLIEGTREIDGEFAVTNENTSYLADNIVFLQYQERDGEIGKTIGVLKKRFGLFERSLRELSIEGDGLHIGDPVTGYRGPLTGTPEPR